MKERTLVLVKPDGVQRGLIGEILFRFERVGLKPIGLKMVYASKELAEKHYIDDDTWLTSVGKKTKESYVKKGNPLDKSEREIGLWVRDQLMNFIVMSPVVAVCLEGNNAVAQVRKMVGDTAPEHAAPGTIRGDFAHETYELADKAQRAVQNLVHASGTVSEAEREINLWFDEDELHSYMRVDESLLYRKG